MPWYKRRPLLTLPLQCSFRSLSVHYWFRLKSSDVYQNIWAFFVLSSEVYGHNSNDIQIHMQWCERKWHRPSRGHSWLQLEQKITGAQTVAVNSKEMRLPALLMLMLMLWVFTQDTPQRFHFNTSDWLL